MRSLFTILLATILTACTGVTNYKHTSSDSDGQIHIFRKSQFNAGGVGAVVYIDDQNILKLYINEYAEFPVSAGKHIISVKSDSATVKDEYEVDVKAGESLYYEIIANPARLIPVLLLPIIDVLAVKTFLLKPSSEEFYAAESVELSPKFVTFANKSIQPNAKASAD